MIKQEQPGEIKIVSLETRLSRVFIGNVSLGVKFSRTLSNDNALLVIAKRKRRKGIIEAEEGKKRQPAMVGSGNATVCDFMWHPGV